MATVLFGNDERQLCGHYAVYYVLSMEQGTKCWITVRVEVDANKLNSHPLRRACRLCKVSAKYATCTASIPVGSPDERRLALPDDWPDELYPLRKDSMDYRFSARRRPPMRKTYEFINELGDKKNNVVPIGPLHVTSDEPGQFRLFVDGENIIDADYRLFYPPWYGKTGGNPHGL